MIMPHFARYVGVAPDTLTVQLPYASASELSRAGLGMIDTSKWWNPESDTGRDRYPYEPDFDASGLRPMGPQFGITAPTPLRLGDAYIPGLIPAIPTDPDLSKVYGYLPV